MNTDYEELVDANDEEEKLKKRLKMKRERSEHILQDRVKKSALFNTPRLGLCKKISFDFNSHVNYLYSESQTGTFFLFLIGCFIFFFSIVTVAVLHYQYDFILAPTLCLFIYHFITAAMRVNLYEGGFFFIQIILQVLLLFLPAHAFIYGFVSLTFTIIHLFVNANLKSLRFYLRVCLVYGFAYLGFGMKQWDTFMFVKLFYLYYLIALAIFWIILNKLTLLQLLFIWIPQFIKLIFTRTCCKPKLRYDYKDVFKHDNKFIMKGKFY
jgi:hypothetical protein